MGRSCSIERDEQGLVTKIADSVGGVRTFERDWRGLLVRSVNQSGGITAFRYDEVGNLLELHDPRGGVTRMRYDGHGNCVETFAPDNTMVQRAYDFFGRVVREGNPNGTHRLITRNARGEMVALRYSNGAWVQFDWDGEGHAVATRTSEGASSRAVWGGFHLLSERVDPNGRVVRFRHGREGELLSIINEKGEQHTLKRDAIGNIVEACTFDGRRTNYRYDAMCRVTRIDDGTDITDFTYNAGGEIVERSYSDGTSDTFEYDDQGDIVRAVGHGAACVYERDPHGRPVAEHHTIDGREFTVRSEYSVVGQRTSRKTSLGHEYAVEFESTGAPRKTVLDGEEVFHQRDETGREILRTLPRGGWIQTQFGPDGGWSARTVHAGETSTVAESYAHEAGVQRVFGGPIGDVEYHHDASGRLTSIHKSGIGAQHFHYDATGNLVATDASEEPRHVGTGNRLSRAGDIEFLWDEKGRLKEKRIASSGGTRRSRYEWAQGGKLAAVVDHSGQRVTFAYDPFGRRVSKSVFAEGSDTPFRTTVFVWDGDVLAHEITTDHRDGAVGGEVVRTYAFEREFEPLAHRERELRSDGSVVDRGWQFYLNDAIGTPERLLSGEGDVVATVARDPWTQIGEQRPEPGERPSTPVRMQGQYEDHETGLFYNRHRYFDPDAGSFITPDPEGVAGGLNVYTRGCNPRVDIDPLGLTRQRGTELYPFFPESDPIRAAYDKTLEQAKAVETKPGDRELKQGNRKCHVLAKMFEENYKGGASITMDPINGDSLETHADVGPNDGGVWGRHVATELPCGKVVDTDQGKIYANRDDWVSDVVKDPKSVTVDPSYNANNPPPSSTGYQDDEADRRYREKMASLKG